MAEKRLHKKRGVKLEKEQFCCSVCLDLLKEPVTINCGHSYCKRCIESCWDQEKAKGVYNCPQCRQTFDSRPVLRKNGMLAEDAACDFCSETRPNKATMSCLTCLASYCPVHLEPHYSVAVLRTHKLVSTAIPLQKKMCSKHNKLMEIYCQTDKLLVCFLCTLEEHRGHKTVPVSVQKAETENHLFSSQKEVQERVQQREKELKELRQTEENLKSGAMTALKDCDCIFAELVSSMQEKCSEVKQLIVSQEKTAVAKAAQMQLQLEEEITKLRRRAAQLEQLSHIDDPIHVIQTFQSLSTSCESQDFSPTGLQRSFADVTDCVSELRSKLEEVRMEIWPRISAAVSYVDFSLPLAPNSREEFLRYCCPLTLDLTSNYPYLHLIKENLRVRPSPSPYSAQPDRFARFPQVLCSEGLSGRCYWEVEWYARCLSAAVAYKDIKRTSDDSRFGNNDKSWTLECTPNGYSFRHNNVETAVLGSTSYKIGVYLDYKAGILCFYHVADPMVLLHKVQTTFTQPLYPGLGLNYEWYDVGVFAQLVKLW
ncbi:E3 ubiquitin-protein ligase TRIM47-like [Channa argus]|uniref:E3 ubiquitin-protein ligase TRIM47-like n=1 Tax=Channa argus TaxID=215402 RepID=UPI003522FC01